MELYFEGTRHTVLKFLDYKKRQLESWKDVGIESRVEIYLRN